MESYNEDTLVAYLDISGFKFMMQSQIDAYRVMRTFYNQGFKTLRGQVRNKVSGFFISDCGILFARDGTPKQRTKKLLEIVAKMNRRMLQYNIMLTTSIAYGHFSYTNLIEHPDIEKSGIFGDGYLNAYLNSEVEKPKMTPGQCRITINGLGNYLNNFEDNKFCYRREKFRLPTIETNYKDKYFYYYWMIDQSSNEPFKECKDFEEAYTECYKYNKEHRYQEMKKVLKRILSHNFPEMDFDLPYM